MSKNIGTPYKRATIADKYDAIVIGSGIGGLAAGAMLSKHAAKKVLVLERHYTAGGYTHVFHRPNYEWDVGVHYIGDVAEGSVLRALFDDLSNRQLKWHDMGPVYDRIILGKEVYDFPKGRENLRAELLKHFPGEGPAIDEYFAAVKSALSTSLTFHTEKALPDLAAAVAGPFLRRKFLHWSSQSTRQVLEGITQNQKLISVLTGQFGDYGLPPSRSSFMVHAMVANHYFEGGYYPIGGSSRMAETIIPQIEEEGGQVLTNAEVAQVVVEGGRAVGVRMAADGRVIHAPVVISDAGVAVTYGKLLAPELVEQHKLRQKLDKVQPSAAHIALYIGLNHSAKDLKLEAPNLWIYPDGNHEKNFDMHTLAQDPNAPLPVVYVSFPAAKDPDFENRHPGRSTIDIITAAPYEWFSKWEGSRWHKRGEEYEALKESLAQRMLDKLYEWAPQVRGKIDMYELSTPLTTKHFCNYEKGEIYGIDHTPERFGQRWLKPRTPIKGLYLTGQDIVTCGVAGALFGGALTAIAVSGQNDLLFKVVREARANR